MGSRCEDSALAWYGTKSMPITPTNPFKGRQYPGNPGNPPEAKQSEGESKLHNIPIQCGQV